MLRYAGVYNTKRNANETCRTTVCIVAIYDFIDYFPSFGIQKIYPIFIFTSNFPLLSLNKSTHSVNSVELNQKQF